MVAQQLWLLLIPAFFPNWKLASFKFRSPSSDRKDSLTFFHECLYAPTGFIGFPIISDPRKIIFWLIPNSCKCLFLSDLPTLSSHKVFSLCICHMSYSERNGKAFMSNCPQQSILFQTISAMNSSVDGFPRMSSLPLPFWHKKSQIQASSFDAFPSSTWSLYFGKTPSSKKTLLGLRPFYLEHVLHCLLN